MPDWPERRRSDAILTDLAALASPTPAVEPLSLPDAAAAAGALYVIEGSRLGGRFLVRGVAAGLPTGYLGDEQPRGRWLALLTALERALPDASVRDRAITAARAVFARFELAARRQLDPNLCER